MRTEQDDINFTGQTSFYQLPKEFVGTLTKNDVTPSVKNVRVWKGSGTVVTITDFDDASDGFLAILGDGTTTISHNANIKTNTGANKLLAVDRLYIFAHISGIFYEN